jgi:hypothetical protein
LIHCQRFFAENCDAVVERFGCHREVNIRGGCQAHRIETALCQHLAVIREHVRDAEFLGDLLGARLCALAECRNLDTGSRSVRQYVSSAEAAPNDTDLYYFLRGCLRHFDLPFFP